jgi:hypothetical protein
MVTRGFKKTSPASHQARAISVRKKIRLELSSISLQGVYAEDILVRETTNDSATHSRGEDDFTVNLPEVCFPFVPFFRDHYVLY